MVAYIRSTTILILVLIVCQGCTFDAVRLNRRAQVYIKHNQYDMAKKVLTESLESDYENSASHYWLGLCHETLNDQANAIWEYELAVRFDPAMDVAQMAYIKALYRNNQIDKSIEATNFFLEHKDAAASEFVPLAESFFSDQMEQHAILTYLAAAKAEPHNAEPLMTLAEHFFTQGNDEKAIDHLILAFKADPYYPGLARRLGELGFRVDIPQPKMFHRPSELEQDITNIEI